jgi:hypothetical protein
MLGFGFVAGFVVVGCYFILRWALSLFVPESAFRSFEDAVGVVAKAGCLIWLAGAAGVIVYAVYFSR